MKLKQMTDHITNNMLANALNEISFDYRENKREQQDFNEFVLDYIKPALKEASSNFLYQRARREKLGKAQAKLDTILESLRQWREQRKLSIEQQNHNLLGNVLDELTELTRAKDDNERIDALCDICVFTINALEKPFNYQEYSGYNIRNENEQFNLIKVVSEDIQCNKLIDIVLLCFGSMRQLGYDPFKAMAETIKEISSRSGKWDKKLGKFVKDAGVYGDQASLTDFEDNIRSTYPDDNVVFDYRDNEVDVNIDYGKTIYTYKLWYRADYDKCRTEAQNENCKN